MYSPEDRALAAKAFESLDITATNEGFTLTVNGKEIKGAEGLSFYSWSDGMDPLWSVNYSTGDSTGDGITSYTYWNITPHIESGKATLKVKQMHKPDQAIASRRAPGSDVFAQLGSTKNRPNQV
ncbi:MAG: hypothetical protein AAGD32_13740 [Planctomycetota bacterium]